jgi:aspartate carbamoyltransferase catalytic subunit
MKHLISIRDLSTTQINKIIEEASGYIENKEALSLAAPPLKNCSVANLFFEPSTRTRASFELAAKRMGACVINLDVNSSARKKGESILDTIYTLEAMDVDIFVIRDAGVGVPKLIADHLSRGSVVNAGEANKSHPTQALLDLMTILQVKGSLDKLNIAIIGDIIHSRVACSDYEIFNRFGANEIRFIGPRELLPSNPPADVKLFDNLKDGLIGADVIIALRIQKERFEHTLEIPDESTYSDRFGLNVDSIKAAKDDVIIMHPGPMNRGIEINSDVADGDQSVIRRQVTNGVAVRMAILNQLFQLIRSNGQ